MGDEVKADAVDAVDAVDAETEAVEIERDAVLALMLWAGWKTADRWSNEKFEEKLHEIAEVKEASDAPDDDGPITTTLLLVLKAVEDGGDDVQFSVIGDGPAKKATKKTKTGDAADNGKSPKPAATPEEKAVKEAEAAKKKAEKEAAKADAKQAKEAARDDVKAEKEAEKAKVKAEKVAAREAKKEVAKAEKEANSGPRYVRNKMYHAGLAVKEYGLDGDEATMIAACNTTFGIANDATSRACVRAAKDAVRGYQSD